MESQSSYTKTIEEATKLFDELLPKDQWKLESNKGDFQVYTRKDTASGLKMARGDAVVNKPISNTLIALEDEQTILKWDDTLSANERIESKDGCDVSRSVDKKQAFITQRETLVASKNIKKDDGSILVIGKSIDLPSCPPRKEYIRAEIILWGWLLTPDTNDSNKTHVVYMIWVDPKGSIPSAIFNAFVDSQAQSAKKMKDYIEKN